jgi:hypothetical protein
VARLPRWRIVAEWMNAEAEGRWYTDPELVLTFIDDDRDDRFGVAVELRCDDEGPYVTGIAVRRHPLAGYRGKRTNVLPRDVQRLPLAKIAAAALAFASTIEKPPPTRWLHPEEEAAGWTARPFDPRVEAGGTYSLGGERWDERFGPEPVPLVEAGRVLFPRGRPERGKSVDFYRELGRAYRELELRGQSPAKAIARGKRVPENTVHQWVHRARRLGFLEPSPRSKRREDDDG